MQKKHILIFILAFFFFLQTLPVFAQGAQCDSCGTSITYSNFGSKTKTGYLCKNCYRQQQEHPHQQKQTQQQLQPKQAQQPQAHQQKQTQSQQVQPKQEQTKQTQQQAQGAQCDNCGTAITDNNLGATIIYKNELGAKTKTGYLCKNCYRKQQEEQQKRVEVKQQKQTQQEQEQLRQKRALSKQQWLQTKQQQHQQQTKEQLKQVQQHNICTLCNKPFEAGKKYYLIHDKPFCSTCYETFKENCRTCGYKIPPNEVVRNGSWVVCTSCSKDIVTTDSQLKECYTEACGFIKSYFGLNVHVPVDRVYFSDMANSDLGGDVGRFFGRKTLRVQKGIENIESLNLESNFIKVQRGMSKFATIKTLIHEAGHACMHQFGYLKESSGMYEEGFAEWCAYKYVMSMGKTWSSTKKRDYVEGLRKMLELEKKMTEDGLLEYVKTHNDFPKE